MEHKIKYPEGGLTINSGQAYPNSTNQTGGSMGATVADPYAFSFSTGATTLTPEQWKKLDAEQQQTIWRKAFDMQGFTQIGPNSFKTTPLLGTTVS